MAAETIDNIHRAHYHQCGLSPTWTVYKMHAQKLNHSNFSCRRRILKMRWRDRIQNQSRKLGRPCPEPTGLEEDNETGAAIYEANHVTAAKAKRETQKSQIPSPANIDIRPLPTCLQCQRTFWTQTGFTGHVWTNCSTHTTQIDASSSASAPPLMSIAKPNGALDSPSPSSTIITTSISAAAAPALTSNANNSDALPNINLILANTNDADSVSTCPQSDSTFA
nr:unnamed protein product [Spirometra erinaceieuropaei]